MSRLPFNRPLRTGGENARIAAALERGWTGGNGPAGEHCQALIRELTGAARGAADALLHRRRWRWPRCCPRSAPATR